MLVVTDGAPGLIPAMEELWPDGDRQRCTVHRWRNVAGKLPKKDTEFHERVEAAYWAVLDEATSPADGEARLRQLVADLERPYPSAAAVASSSSPDATLVKGQGKYALISQPRLWQATVAPKPQTRHHLRRWQRGCPAALKL